MVFVLLDLFYLSKACVGVRKTDCEEPSTRGPALLGTLHSLQKRFLCGQHYQQGKREWGTVEEEEEVGRR